MPERDQHDRIGTPDPEHEPKAPKVDDAGTLGEVGLHKREKDQIGEKNKGIWGSRPPTRDDDPAESATRKPEPLPD
jgi:hypothetical protein